jgi:hypothetical protein
MAWHGMARKVKAGQGIAGRADKAGQGRADKAGQAQQDGNDRTI